MNKGELIEEIAAKIGITKKAAGEALDATVDVIMTAVASGNKVTVVGFGSFEKRLRQQRNGRNPKTGETMTIPESNTPAFTAGASFKERVN